jgi:CPA1 family monovalent cation:H+ antiporter
MEHTSIISSAVWGVFTLLLVALGILLVAKRTRLPFTVLLVLVGIVLSGLQDRYPEALRLLDTLQVSPDLILFVFLPTLIFESSYHLDARRLRHNLTPILFLAVPGLLLSTGLIGLIVWLATDIPLVAALLLGAILSATDPVAVIALFKQLGAPENLTTLVEGESLLNDASAIVVSRILVAILAAGAFSGDLLLTGAVDFLVLFVGGLLVGMLMGYIVSTLIGWVESEPFVEIGLTTALAYLSFMFAEQVLHLSGVMATLGAGLVLGTWAAILILAILPISGYEGAGSRWGMSVLAAGGRRTGTT